MIYLILFIFLILIKNNAIEAKQNLKKPNILTFINFSNTNLLEKQKKRIKEKFNTQNNKWNLLTNDEILNKNIGVNEINDVKNFSGNLDKTKVNINNVTKIYQEEKSKVRQNVMEKMVEKILKKKKYKKLEKLLCCNNSIKDMKKNIKLYFFKKRIIYLTDEINKKTSDELIKQLLYLDNINHNDIKIYINSPGGSINEGLAILDIFNYIKSDIQTISFGLVASMASVILASGKKGKRKSFPNCRIMIHQPLGNAYGHPHDIEIQTKEILYLKKLLYYYLSKFTNKNEETIEKHSDRDYYMNAYEAKEYGIVDEVVETKLTHPYFIGLIKN
ncbi:ATP-dependent Clp protease proteolytic subunit, putative [Plasmodium berghei]|uniref:ATP-dependent Clp protease proteolytic subunit n=3 Tax=Plasmodium berghei TaxID=5821 RepID=A0A509AI40_PLABA|nr:ATP-dependent Clp protease proteolytic subunit, putative [Plasmodium berghei ANKA]CXI00593.1 ATP-dependent Clp protease proteolytic subunit, putative [Plasmodium berghei]SCL91705.1 ATP-dependent Clp protease proteolytic subunit, putative [Plasmodium berghei]SCM15516.1 ATP-dependent Clp protease proteolytic subunit, putative [Plasmodium berghei]SCN22509.1 ATP-dependent Clp protease proteolytic subunit, putative [Plasmodium berghei]VUC54281.1 ATP-dependent Clp protease proteolytic subunit, pu|eukprot:XP_034420114.1 ATP-dependent Clp protease proteolytic subunit, putative [Plasmodium berghei ANKA]